MILQNQLEMKNANITIFSLIFCSWYCFELFQPQENQTFPLLNKQWPWVSANRNILSAK